MAINCHEDVFMYSRIYAVANKIKIYDNHQYVSIREPYVYALEIDINL